MQKSYDYIIAGMGGAGLGLAYHISLQPALRHKRVLLLDSQAKNKNDRTWCFWEKGEGPFESIVHKSWQKIYFHGEDIAEELPMKPYQYKMIRGIDFYEMILKRLAGLSNFEIKYDTIQELKSSPEVATVVTNQAVFHAGLVFSSILPGNLDFTGYHYVMQHFKGWFVETKYDFFDDSVATFMDFRVEQEGEVRFFYVLPTSRRKALVELAVFSKKLWEDHQYESALKNYSQQHLNLSEYAIVGEEFGVIPMTNYPFAKHDTSRIIHIGTAGGMVQASTGFAFKNMQNQASFIASQLASGKTTFSKTHSFDAWNRYNLYDATLLHVLLGGKLSGKKVFSEIFKNNPTPRVFDFLDRNTTFLADVKLMSSVPIFPFMAALSKEVVSQFRRF